MCENANSRCVVLQMIERFNSKFRGSTAPPPDILFVHHTVVSIRSLFYSSLFGNVGKKHEKQKY